MTTVCFGKSHFIKNIHITSRGLLESGSPQFFQQLPILCDFVDPVQTSSVLSGSSHLLELRS